MKAFTLSDETSGILPNFNKPVKAGQHRAPQVEELLAFVERMTSARDLRREIAHDDIFADPAWDMLIHLFHANLAGYRVTITNLARASGVPHTTALRWMDTLQARRLANRVQNPYDRRSVFIELTESARSAVYDYLCKTWVNYYA